MKGSYFGPCPKPPRSRKGHDPSSLLLLVDTALDHRAAHSFIWTETIMLIWMCRLLYILQFKIMKRHKGPHIVHLSTMCHFSKDPPGRPFLFTDRPKNTILDEDIRILFSAKFH